MELLVIIICIAIFLLLRAFWLWYWKIDNRLNQLRKQSDYLHIIAELLLDKTTEERKKEIAEWLEFKAK